jgi:tRNA-dihydrouridine synthase
MNMQWIKCENGYCDSRLRVQIKYRQSKPVFYCGEACLNPTLLQNEKMSQEYYYEDSEEIRQLVNNLVNETKRLKNEVQSLRKIRKNYFGVFNDYNLKPEVYERKWSVKNDVNLNIQWIKCKNGHCNNRIGVELTDEFEAVLFCDEECLDSYFSQKEVLNVNSDYEDENPNGVRKLVENLINETKRLQNEVQNLRRIRKTYFELFKGYNLKPEVYKRKWSFDSDLND